MSNKSNKNLKQRKCSVCKTESILSVNTNLNQNLTTLFLLLKISILVLNNLPLLYENFHLFFNF